MTGLERRNGVKGTRNTGSDENLQEVDNCECGGGSVIKRIHLNEAI